MRAILWLCLSSSFFTVSAATIVFVGPGNDWSDPTNWSPQTVPTTVDDVVIGSGQTAIMSNLGGSTGPYVIASLMQEVGSTVEITQSQVEVSGGVSGIDDSFLNLFESSLTSSGVNASPTLKSQKLRGPFGIKLNPSIMISNGLAELSNTAMTFVLGGPLPAQPGGVGQGFYGHLETQDAALFSLLSVELKYGFEPSPGDVFEIMDISGTRNGTFSNVGEGDTVATFNGVDLMITYAGGDGNDVALIATATAAIPTLGTAALAIFILLFLAAAINLSRKTRVSDGHSG